jgi:hypothetical protein
MQALICAKSLDPSWFSFLAARQPSSHLALLSLQPNKKTRLPERVLRHARARQKDGFHSTPLSNHLQ